MKIHFFNACEAQWWNTRCRRFFRDARAVLVLPSVAGVGRSAPRAPLRQPPLFPDCDIQLFFDMCRSPSPLPSPPRAARLLLPLSPSGGGCPPVHHGRPRRSVPCHFPCIGLGPENRATTHGVGEKQSWRHLLNWQSQGKSDSVHFGVYTSL